MYQNNHIQNKSLQISIISHVCTTLFLFVIPVYTTTQLSHAFR